MVPRSFGYFNDGIKGLAHKTKKPGISAGPQVRHPQVPGRIDLVPYLAAGAFGATLAMLASKGL